MTAAAPTRSPPTQRDMSPLSRARQATPTSRGIPTAIWSRSPCPFGPAGALEEPDTCAASAMSGLFQPVGPGPDPGCMRTGKSTLLALTFVLMMAAPVDTIGVAQRVFVTQALVLRIGTLGCGLVGAEPALRDQQGAPARPQCSCLHRVPDRWPWDSARTAGACWAGVCGGGTLHHSGLPTGGRGSTSRRCECAWADRCRCARRCRCHGVGRGCGRGRRGSWRRRRGGRGGISGWF